MNPADPTGTPIIDFGFHKDQAGPGHHGHRPPHRDRHGPPETVESSITAPYMPALAEPDRPALLDLIRTRTQTMYHPVGTCAMGGAGTAVVDPALRVRGVDGLRVVDASVMPAVVRGNTNAPGVMIAEKAANLILER